MSKWIDFRALRRELDFEKVLTHYGVELHIRNTDHGRQHSGPCPIKTCKSTKKAFSVNLERGIWQCFSCKEHGNALDLILFMEGLERSKGEDVRKAAEIAKERFIGKKRQSVPVEKFQEAESVKATLPTFTKTLVNEPLDFTLQSLDGSHAWFSDNGLTPRTVDHFGLGFCTRGWLKGRIAIPLRRGDGKLIGYAGRLLDDRIATPENPLYVFPETRIHKGIQYEFRRSEFLYNGNSMGESVSRLLTTQRIESVWTLWQHGYVHTVSLMDDLCSARQCLALVSAVDASGVAGFVSRREEERLAAEFLSQLFTSRAVRWFAVETERFPFSFDAVTLNKLIGVPEHPVL